MFADLDETIRQLLIKEVPLPAAVSVNFEAPDRDWLQRWNGLPTVNCFLYDIRENVEFREADWRVERSNGEATLRGGPLLIDGTYHITVWSKQTEDEHRLLWQVLAAVMRHRTLPPALLAGELKDQPFPVRAQAAQPNQTRSNPADLWQAVDNRIRPGVSYVITLALDPEIRLDPAKLISTRTAHVADLKRRPLASLKGNDASLRDEADLTDIAGRVVDKKGQPVKDASVRLHGSAVEVTTDADGRFVIRHVRTSDPTVHVRATGQKKASSRTLQVPAARYELEIPRG